MPEVINGQITYTAAELQAQYEAGFAGNPGTTPESIRGYIDSGHLLHLNYLPPSTYKNEVGSHLQYFDGGAGLSLVYDQPPKAAPPYVPPVVPKANDDLANLTTERSAYGQVIPSVRGAVRLKGTLIFRTPIKENLSSYTTQSSKFVTNPNAASTPDQGRGIDGQTLEVTTTTSFSVKYTSSAAVLICDTFLTDNGGVHLLRVWANGNLIVDNRFFSVLANKVKYRYYNGGQSLADPFLVSEKGAAETPAFIGCAYIVFEDFDVSAFGGSFPTFEFEVAETITSSSESTVLAYVPPLVAPLNDVTNDQTCIDYSSSLFYSFINDYPDNIHYLATISLQTQKEIRRVKIQSSAYDIYYFPIAIPGGEYILSVAQLVSSSNTHTVLINVTTGAITSHDETNPGDETDFYSVVPYLSGYLVFGVGIGNQIAVFTVNVGTGTITRLASPPVGIQSYVAAAGASSGLSEFVGFTVNDTNSAVLTVRVNNGVVTVKTAFGVQNVSAVAWDGTDNTLIVSGVNGSTGFLRKMSLDGSQILWQTLLPLELSVDNLEFIVISADTLQFELTDGMMIVENATDVDGGVDEFYLLDTSDGSLELLLNNPTISHVIYISGVRLVYWVLKDDYPNWTQSAVGQNTPVPLAVSDLLKGFAVKAGYSPSVVSVTGLDGLTVGGMIVRDPVRYRDAMQSVATLYSTTVVDSDGGLKIRRPVRSDSFASDATIEDAAVTESAAGGRIAKLNSTRSKETDIPIEIAVSYLDINTDYEISTQVSRRPKGLFKVSTSNRRETISVPIAMSADEARRRSLDVLYTRVTAKVKVTFGIAPKYGYVESGDVVDIGVSGQIYTCRITQAIYKADYSQEMQAELFLTADASSVAGATAIDVTKIEAALAMSSYYHLDIPLFSGADDQAGTGLMQYYVMSGKGQPNWTGAILYRSSDDISFGSVDSEIGVYPPIARANNILAAPAFDFQTDYVNSLNISVIAGSLDSLASISYLDRMNGNNSFAVGDVGRWEVISAGTVTHNSDGSITLSELTRGVHGSEIFEGSHLLGDKVIMLTTQFVRKLVYSLASLNALFFFKPVGVGQFLSLVATVQARIPGVAEKPYAPVHLAAYLNSGDDIELAWVRRSRIDFLWPDGDETPALGEASESYAIEILSSGSPDLVRTLTSSTPRVVYSNADVVADFGSVPATIKFAVYQVSAVVGRGHRAEATVPVI